MRRICLALATLLACQLPVLSASKGDQVVKASLVADTASIESGKSFRVGVRLIMDPGWHTYWKNPGDAGLATTVAWKLPKGFSAGKLGWPSSPPSSRRPRPSLSLKKKSRSPRASTGWSAKRSACREAPTSR